MRFAPSTGWSSKSALYFLTAFAAAALLLFALLTATDNAGAQQSATATRTPTPTASPDRYTPTPTPFAGATPQPDDVFIDSVDAGIHIIDGLIDAEQREHSETTFPQNGAAPSADQTSGPIWSFPDDMSQDLRAKYRAAFEVMHQLSEQRFGVSVNLAELTVEIVTSHHEPTCGVATLYTGGDMSFITIFHNHNCRSISGPGEVTEIASAVMAHEYFHVLHHQLENDVELIGRMMWLYEGSSEHFKHIYLHHIGATNYIDIRDYLNSLSPSVRADLVQAYQSYPPLRTHGQGGPVSDLGTIYEIGLFAVQYLLEQTGARTHIDFFRRPGGETFEDIFGVSLDTFYTSFEAHLAAGLPLPGARLPGAPFLTPTATATPGPTHTPTATATPRSDGCDNGVVVPDPANYPDLVEACAALLKAAPTLAAEPPLNWSVNIHIERWEGVDFSYSTPLYPLQVVNGLHLLDRGLTGSIPPILGDLSHLHGLSLDDNQLTGNIPPELGNLSNLNWLLLNDNQLTGEIPSELGNIPGLARLYISGNQLSGCIPASLQDLEADDFSDTGLQFCDGSQPPTVSPTYTATPVRTPIGGDIERRMSALEELIRMLQSDMRAIENRLAALEIGSPPPTPHTPTPTWIATPSPTPTSVSGGDAPTPTYTPTSTRVPGTEAETFASISTGDFSTCGLRVDGTATCWGAFDYALPEGETFTLISAGGSSACVLHADGFAVCWGPAQLTPPTDETFVSIGASFDFACGLRADGTVACWGNNEYGQSSPPEGETFTSISVTHYHACGLRADGAAVCWGYDDGRSRPPSGETFASISAGGHHTCGLREDGAAVCWSYADYTTSPPAGAFTSISAGTYHACGLRENGTAECWGQDHEGSTSPPGGAFTSMSAGGAGGNHTCGLREDGTAVCWGWQTP